MILTLSIIVVVLALGGHSLATVPGPNGRIVWGSFNPDIGDADIYTANPDGAHETRVAGPSECPRWSPDGSRILLPGRSLSASSLDAAQALTEQAAQTPIPAPGAHVPLSRIG